MASGNPAQRVYAGVALLLALGLILALQACVLKKEPAAADVRAEKLANAQIPQAWVAPGATQGGVADGWLGKFNDPQLQAMVAEALAYNTDLSEAAARVEQAAAYVKAAGGELYPAIGFLGRAGTEDSSGNTGLQGVIVSASWELDVWGRVRYGVRGAEDQYSASQADYSFARQSLVALVAKSWFLAIEASLQQQLASEMVDAAGKLLALAESRQRIGIGSEYEVVQARANLDSYRDGLLQVDLAREQGLRALEVLLGRYPSAEIAVARRLPVLEAYVQAGLPAELLERRPDVIAAERRVGAAFNLVRQARAARLPAISLTGSGSDLTSDLFVLKDRDNPVWGAGGSVFAPLFSGGALRAQVDVKTAQQQQTMAAYASTVLKAVSDVEGALSAESAMRAREAVLQANVADAEQTLRFAETRYRVGSADLRSVEQQQLAYHSARMNLLRVQSEQRVQRVNLHLALGGDFTVSR